MASSSSLSFAQSLLEFLDICPDDVSTEARGLLDRLHPSLLNRYLDLNIDVESFSFGREEDRRDSGYYDVDTKKVEYTFPELIKRYFLLPWRQDQRESLNKFLDFLLPTNQNKRVMYIQAVFGSGKTTMLKAMVFFLLLNNHEYVDSDYRTRSHIVSTNDILITAYNLSVKNELEEEMRRYLRKNVEGHHRHYSKFSKSYNKYENRVFNIQTYDSIIHEINSVLGSKYSYDDARFHAEKRLYAYSNVKKLEKTTTTSRRRRQSTISSSNTTRNANVTDKREKDIKYLFLDEAQDLDGQALELLLSYYPNAKLIILGDIFQSIQREPRENLLYRLLSKTNSQGEIVLKGKFFANETDRTIRVDRNIMYLTPRVPPKILETLKEEFINHYSEKINNLPFNQWKSTSSETESKIVWRQFGTFKELFEKIANSFKDDNNQEYDEIKIKNSMILSYTSEITVNDKCGDIHRGMKELINTHSIDKNLINSNYKIKEQNKLFMSTMASSKGLEADNVIVILSDNIDKKHSLSEDVVMNLLCVAFSRCKKKLTVYFHKGGKLGPTFVSRFSHHTQLPPSEFHGDLNIDIVKTLLRSHTIETLTEQSDIFSSQLYNKMRNIIKLNEDQCLRTYRPLCDRIEYIGIRDARTFEERKMKHMPIDENRIQTKVNKDIFYYFLLQEFKNDWLNLSTHQGEQLTRIYVPDHLKWLSDEHRGRLEAYRLNTQNHPFSVLNQEYKSIENQYLEARQQYGLLSTSQRERCQSLKEQLYPLFKIKMENAQEFFLLKSLLMKQSNIKSDIPDVRHFFDLYYNVELTDVFNGSPGRPSSSLFDFIRGDGKDCIRYNFTVYGDHLITGIPSILCEKENHLEIWIIDSQRLVSKEEGENRTLIHSQELLYRETRLLRGINLILNHIQCNEVFDNLENKKIELKIVNIYERLWYKYLMKPKPLQQQNQARLLNEQNNTDYYIKKHHVEDFKSLKRDIKETILFHNLKTYLSKINFLTDSNENDSVKVDVNNFFFVDGEYHIDENGTFQWKRAIILEFVGACNFNIVYDKKVYKGGRVTSDMISEDLDQFFSNGGTIQLYQDFCILEEFAKLFHRRQSANSRYTSANIKSIVSDRNFQLHLHSKFEKREDLLSLNRKRCRLDFQYTQNIIDTYLSGFLNSPTIDDFLQDDKSVKVFVSNTLPKSIFQKVDIDQNLKQSDDLNVVDRIEFYPVHKLYKRPIVFQYFNDIGTMNFESSSKMYINPQNDYIKFFWGEYNPLSKKYYYKPYCTLNGEYYMFGLHHPEEHLEKKTSLKFLTSIVDRMVYQIAQLKAKYYFYA